MADTATHVYGQDIFSLAGFARFGFHGGIQPWGGGYNRIPYIRRETGTSCVSLLNLDGDMASLPGWD